MTVHDDPAASAKPHVEVYTGGGCELNPGAGAGCDFPSCLSSGRLRLR
jgi:hypothetical protein